MTPSTSIFRVPILPFGMVNAHVIKGPKGCVVVDAGLPGSEAHFAKALRRRGLGFEDVTLIVITHAHIDHAGGAKALRAVTRAPSVAHAGDLPYYRRERSMTFCATGVAGAFLLKRGIATAPYEAFEPDILLQGDQTLDLRAFGVEGRVVPTLGHTEGSLSVVLDSHEALVGDLVASGVFMGGILRTSHAIRPPFEADPRAVGKALEQVVACGSKTFYMGHGGPLKAAEVRRHAQHLLQLNPAPQR